MMSVQYPYHIPRHVAYWSILIRRKPLAIFDNLEDDKWAMAFFIIRFSICYTYTYIYTCTCTCTYTYTYTCTSTYIYTYILYVYTHTHTNSCVIHMSLCRNSASLGSITKKAFLQEPTRRRYTSARNSSLWDRQTYCVVHSVLSLTRAHILMFSLLRGHANAGVWMNVFFFFFFFRII